MVIVLRSADVRTLPLSLWKKGNGLGHDLMFTPTLAIIGFPSALLKSSINNRAIALAQILPTMFGLLSEDHDINVTHFFFLIIRLSKATIDR